jgi:hypothetical protein
VNPLGTSYSNSPIPLALVPSLVIAVLLKNPLPKLAAKLYLGV